MLKQVCSGASLLNNVGSKFPNIELMTAGAGRAKGYGAESD